MASRWGAQVLYFAAVLAVVLSVVVRSLVGRMGQSAPGALREAERERGSPAPQL